MSFGCVSANGGKESDISDLTLKQISAGVALAALALATISCSASAKNEIYFGKTEPPRQNVLRYVTGDEPESLDPQVSTG